MGGTAQVIRRRVATPRHLERSSRSAAAARRLRGASAGLPAFAASTADAEAPLTAGTPAPPIESPADRLARGPSAPGSRDAACDARLDQAERFAGSTYGPEDVIGAGGFGGFSASYHPFGGPGILLIRQSVAVEFKDTLVQVGGFVMPHPDLPHSPGLLGLAFGLNSLPLAARLAIVSRYQWAPPEQAHWMERVRGDVESSWEFQHGFVLNRPQWDWLGARVGVSLAMHQRAKTPADHMSLETYKTPPTETLRTFDISHRVRRGSATDARDQSMRLASNTEKRSDLLRRSVRFAHDSSDLTPAAERTLRRFIQRFNGAIAHPAHQEIRVDLVAHTSASGSNDHNRRLAEARARRVREFLRAEGFHAVDTRIVDDIAGEREADQADPDRARDRRVDLVVDGGERMNIAVHEWGHAFGLGDEYAGDSRAIGGHARHHEMAAAMTSAEGENLPGAAVEHNGGVMSFGNDMRPRHYATFHHALERVTAESPWSLGEPRLKSEVDSSCDRPAGDFPQPEGDTRTA